MTSTQQLRDTQLLEMLTAGRSSTDAAAALNCSVSTVYRRLADPGFRVRLSAARAGQWAPDVERIRGTVTKAIDTMLHLLENAGHESTRLRAAEVLIRQAVELRKFADLEEQVTTLQLQLAQLEKDRHGTDSTEEDEDAEEGTEALDPGH